MRVIELENSKRKRRQETEGSLRCVGMFVHIQLLISCICFVVLNATNEKKISDLQLSFQSQQSNFQVFGNICCWKFKQYCIRFLMCTGNCIYYMAFYRRKSPISN